MKYTNKGQTNKDNHTKGQLKQEHRIVDKEGNYSTEVFTDEGTVICEMKWAGEKIGNKIYSRRADNAKRIVKCWNMHDELVEMLKEVDRQNGIPPKDWDEKTYKHCQEVKALIKKAE